MTKKLLDIELIQVGDYVFGRVKEQDESLRSGTFAYDSGCIRIAGGNPYPALYRDSNTKTSLYLRGTDKRNDHTTFMTKYTNEKEATKYADLIAEAVQKLNTDPSVLNEAPTTPLKCRRVMG